MSWLFQPLLIVDTGAVAYSLAADSGAFALAGQDATLTHESLITHYTLTADAGLFVLTGVIAITRYAHRLIVTSGALTLTGFAAALSVANAEAMLAAKGTLTLTGIDVTLRAIRAYRITAVAGTFVLTGIAANVLRTFNLIVASFALTLTSVAANLVVTITQRLLAQTGMLSLIGHEINLVYDTVTHYTAEPLLGSFVLTGQDVILVIPYTRQPGRLRFGRPVPVTWRL